jgi:dimethylargininase
MDGGDVLVAGRTMFVGASSRTNAEGIEQIRRLVEHFGYSLTVVEVTGCLHLKSAVTPLTDEMLLINPRWAPADVFDGFALVHVHADEPAAANIVRIGRHFLYSAGYPRTLDLLVKRGLEVTTVDVSEIAKAEGAVTCCSLILETA